MLCCFLLLGELQAAKLRVASYNLRNYLSMERSIQGRYHLDAFKPAEELKALYSIIVSVRPDILALQEIGTHQDLQRLQADLKKQGLNYPHSILLKGPDTTRRLAVLSKIPFAHTQTHQRIPIAYPKGYHANRGLLEVGFEVEGIRWALFNLHLKSRLTSRKFDPMGKRQRTAEAMALSERIAQRGKLNLAKFYLVLGDFNDTLSNPTVHHFLKRGNREVAELIGCADSDDKDWTFHYRRGNRRERVDFILMSKAFKKLGLPHQGYAFKYTPQQKIASDHRLIYIDITFPDKP